MVGKLLTGYKKISIGKIILLIKLLEAISTINILDFTEKFLPIYLGSASCYSLIY